MMQINYKEKLNSSQWEAVKTTDGPVLIVAGAGSGKTRTLIYRVAYLVEKGVDPERIMLLTFTKKAAREMLNRASSMLDRKCSKVAGGTFHSIANRFLRKYAKAIGFKKNFTIADRSDSADIVGLLRTKIKNEKDEQGEDIRLPKKTTIEKVLSRSTNKDKLIAQIIEENYPKFKENVSEIKKISELYKKYKKERSIMDFNDLLIYFKKLLKENDRIRKKISNKYKYIMVDEFQDTNEMQAEIAYLLSSSHKNLCVVGDDSQSIYSFRGANFKNIINFPDNFSDAKVITLERNYRSTQPILNLTNSIIKQAEEKYSKELFTKKQKGEKPVFVEAKDENQQSGFVVEKVKELEDQGVSLDDMAVLFRNGWHSNDLEIELTKENIPFKKYGGLKFVEAAHIKDVIAYLKVILNIEHQVSWNRVLKLIRGIGSKTAAKLILKIKEKGLEGLVDKEFKGKKYSQDLEKLYSTLKKAKKLSVKEATETIIDYYKPFLETKFDDFHKRVDDFDSLVSIAKRYDNLDRLLSDLSLEPLNASQAGSSSQKEEDTLTLSTIHSAKGLEWNTVFLISAVDGILPSRFSTEKKEELEEERRLLYVAVTRAKENLFIIKPNMKQNRASYFATPSLGVSNTSRFLTQGDILEKYTIKKTLFRKDQDNNDMDQEEEDFWDDQEDSIIL